MTRVMTSVMWLKLLIGVLRAVDWVKGADWADGPDRGDGTDVAEMALRMNALFYFGCSFHNFKNIAYIGLWEPYAVTVGWDRWMGRNP